MARIRTVKPEFWGAPKTARVSRDARLLFLGLLNESDDEGRQLGSAKRIAGVVFPNDSDVSEPQVDAWLTELERVHLIERYVVDRIAYVLICGFVEHQKISHPSPSRLPKPSGVSPEALPKYSGSVPEVFLPDLGSGSRNLDLGSSAPPKKTARNGHAKHTDPLWESLLEACGVDPTAITPSSRGGYNRALKEIRDAGGTCETIRARARLHAGKWPGVTVTPNSLAKHWAELSPPTQVSSARRGNFKEKEFVSEPF
jgi:hypothetical protein